MTAPMSTVIYINGQPHNTTGVASVFFADHPSLPNRYCSQHNIGTSAAAHLRAGGAVRTGGNHYSLSPPMAEANPHPRFDPLPAPKPLPGVSKRHQEIVVEIDARMRKAGWRAFWFGVAFIALGYALRGTL